MDDVTWAALTLTLTAAGAAYTWRAYHRRGPAAGLKGAGLTLLPLAAYLTKTLQMFTRIVDAVVDWATSLVFSPVVWMGVILAGAGIALIAAGRLLEGRRGEPRAAPRVARTRPGRAEQELTRGGGPRNGPVADDDLADIEAILKKRGIT